LTKDEELRVQEGLGAAVSGCRLHVFMHYSSEEKAQVDSSYRDDELQLFFHYDVLIRETLLALTT
jgi:hypothetical protein